MGESPRWQAGQFWMCDWLAGEVLAFGGDGNRQVITRVTGLPFSIDWLADGRLVVTTTAGVMVGPGLEPYGPPGQAFNEVVVDGAGRVWVDRPGSMPWEERKPGIVAVVLPDGTWHQLTSPADAGVRKTRIVAAALERLGLRTRLSERAFDEQFRVVSHADQNRREPLVALAGFDDVTPRRLLGDAGFEHTVDAGLGTGPVEYLDMVLHTFPATVDPVDAFEEAVPRDHGWGPAYEAEVERQAASGTDRTAARCGMLDIAGITVGAAFVGTVAATLAVADILRVLHDGENYSVVALDLREPNRIKAIPNANPGRYIPKYTAAAQTFRL